MLADLKRALGAKAEAALRDVLAKKRKPSELAVEVVVEHARYSARAKLPPDAVASIAEDLL